MISEIKNAVFRQICENNSVESLIEVLKYDESDLKTYMKISPIYGIGRSDRERIRKGLEIENLLPLSLVEYRQVFGKCLRIRMAQLLDKDNNVYPLSYINKILALLQNHSHENGEK